jgi:hypothetical protein
MAARQDQTLQIFLIVFIFLFLVTSVVAYLGWRGYSDSDQKANALQTQLNDKNTQLQNKGSELEDLKEKVGFGRNDNPADVKKAADADMETYGAGVADKDSRSYRKVLASVFAELQQSTAREAKLTADLKARDTHLLAVETETKKMIDEHDKARKTAEEDLADQKNKFADDRKALETTKAELQKSLDDQRKAYTGQLEERDKKLKTVSDHNAKLEHAVDDLKAQRKDEPESFEVADGRISWVNQNGTVWINLGTADSLRRQVTFSVFDADLHDAAKSKKKGSIEVTRLLSDHMAEARITKDDPKNPILTGDNIYSQIWHRGKQLHFALTGFIDFDGDGQSDLQLARELIELNGGIVDAYLDDNAKVQGEITANTRYLVYGEKSDAVSQAKFQQPQNDMFKEASSLGVQTITLPEFLTQMGYKPQDRTVHLGAAATGRDFPAKPQNETDTLGPAAQFRSRALTPSTSQSSASKP